MLGLPETRDASGRLDTVDLEWGMSMSTAIILAGGNSRRMGRDKLVLEYGHQTLLDAAITKFSESFDRVYVSVANLDKYPHIAAEKVEDIYKNCGPMGGLHAALSKTASEGVFLCAADLPFADPAAAKRIIALCGDCDVSVMVDDQGRYEPLFGYYSKTILPLAEKALSSGNYKMISLFEDAEIRTVTRAELGGLWKDKLLANINCIEDYDKFLG